MRPFEGALFLAAMLSLGRAAEPTGDVRKAEREPWSRVDMPDTASAGRLRLALDGAARRLADGKCQAVLTDFADGSGRPLTAKLDEMRVSPATYLSWILFRDGTDTGRCRQDATVAFTVAGNRVVYVCGRRFTRAFDRNRSWTEAVVIHEALHTLGLGENPPTSDQITRRVLKRCQ